MKQLPIACSLDAAGAHDQLAAWRALAPWQRSREDLPDGVRVRYAPDAADEVARVAAAELACCAFLDITVERTASDVVVEIHAPDPALAADVRLLGVV